MPNKKINDIEKSDKNIDELLYDFNKRYENDQKIAELNSKLDEINGKYKKVTGGNIIEFLSSIEMNSIRNNSNNKSNKIQNKMNSIQQLLQESMGSVYFNDEKERFMRYDDYRMIDAYIPELSKCLDIYRDCILSPDDITKKSLNYYYKNELINNEEFNKMIFKNLKFIDREYKISKEIKNQIRECLLLGDLFTIVLDINEATNKLLKEDDIFVNSNEDEEIIVNESMIGFDDFKDFESLFEMPNNSNKKSLKERNEKIEKAKKDIVDSINNNIKFYKNPLDLLSDTKKYENKNNTKLDLKGSIVKVPDPESIIKIDLDNHVIGYIYIEKNAMEFSDSGFTNRGINNMNRLMDYKNNDVYNSRYDFLNSDNTTQKTKFGLITDIFVRGISRKIDNKFINDNKDFKRLIYTLLKQDYILEKQVCITFLKPEEVFHLPLDSNKTYGISKLAKSLFASKIYLATLITNLMQKVSRGRDKRAFYIDTSIDLDYEGTIQSFIRDIKSKEINSDNMLRSVSTVLNTVGAFEDYFLPTIDGEKPVEIDTISGMDVEIDNDFLNTLLKSAVAGTGVPANYIEDISQVDYARTLAMQNQGFVRSIIQYQYDFSEYYSEIIRKIYYNEFMSTNKEKKSDNNTNEESINIDEIYVKFPPPIYLNLTTVNDQIGNASSTTDFLTNIYFSENSEDKNIEDKKLIFKKNLISNYFLPTMDWQVYDKIFEEATIEAEKKSLENEKPKESEDSFEDNEDDEY